jgi:hypothetical protein
MDNILHESWVGEGITYKFAGAETQKKGVERKHKDLYDFGEQVVNPKKLYFIVMWLTLLKEWVIRPK